MSYKKLFMSLGLLLSICSVSFAQEASPLTQDTYDSKIPASLDYGRNLTKGLDEITKDKLRDLAQKSKLLTKIDLSGEYYEPNLRTNYTNCLNELADTVFTCEQLKKALAPRKEDFEADILTFCKMPALSNARAYDDLRNDKINSTDSKLSVVLASITLINSDEVISNRLTSRFNNECKQSGNITLNDGVITTNVLERVKLKSKTEVRNNRID